MSAGTKAQAFCTGLHRSVVNSRRQPLHKAAGVIMLGSQKRRTIVFAVKDDTDA
jgi:hypothetical protein